MKILIVAGMPGAGKEEFLSVAESMNIPFARMGDVVREAYSCLPESERGMGIGQFADSERKKFGKNIWARRIAEKMDGGLFLIDGCRSMDEVRAFREMSDDVLIIGIHSPPDVRYLRLVKRGRADAPKNIAEFNERDAREISWGLAEVLVLSDLTLVNNSALDSFRSLSGNILEGLR
ncbi:MAG: AAA family ATPase [Candidatus Methanoplasma sp.]|jgi:dephospho-CoA kinase|nr:AAA family ATPase [Candidatus Methanoplasma sp.]